MWIDVMYQYNPATTVVALVDNGDTRSCIENVLGTYSLTILKNDSRIVLQIFLPLEAFESNTTPDLLQHTI